MSLRAKLLNVALRRTWKSAAPGANHVAHTRASLDRAVAMMPKVPSHVKRTTTRVGSVAAQWVEVPRSRTDRVLLFTHGGSYISGSTESHRNLIWRLASAARCRVLALDYRLAPEHPYPAALEDLLAAYDVLRQSEPRARIAVGGDSAGGGLMLAGLAALGNTQAPMPCAAVGLSPWTDLAFSGRSWRENDGRDPWMSQASLAPAARSYCGGTAADDPALSPAYAHFARPVPTLLHVGADEVLRDDSKKVAERLRACGGDVELQIWPEVPHVWHMFAPLLPEAKAAIRDVARFLDSHW